jgi:thiamine biosynthesis lipoprotein
VKRPFSLKEASARWWVLLVVLVAGSVATYLGRPAVKVPPAKLEGRTMGTTWSVLLNGPRDEARLRQLKAGVEALLAEVNASMSTYDPTSELSRFNALESTEPVTLSAPLAAVIRDALVVHHASGGSFDVTVGPLVEAWGFGAKGRPRAAPTDEEVARLLEAVGSGKLSLDGAQLAKAHPKLRVDLSAIAKGDAVDRVSALLVDLGEPNHLVDIGGELRARGLSASGEAFRVGIETPDPSTRRVQLAVALRDRSIASSGNYRNVFELDGVRYVHTIDPVTGRPVQHRLLAASVLHERCGLADAWATALMAAGPERAWALANQHGLDVVLMEDGPDGGLLERMTPGFARAMIPRGGEPR